MNSTVAAHLFDPGANGLRARLTCLPVAVNGKHTPPFPCRLESCLSSKSTLWNQIPLTSNLGWIDCEINQWLADRISQRDKLYLEK